VVAESGSREARGGRGADKEEVTVMRGEVDC